MPPPCSGAGHKRVRISHPCATRRMPRRAGTDSRETAPAGSPCRRAEAGRRAGTMPSRRAGVGVIAKACPRLSCDATGRTRCRTATRMAPHVPQVRGDQKQTAGDGDWRFTVLARPAERAGGKRKQTQRRHDTYRPRKRTAAVRAPQRERGQRHCEEQEQDMHPVVMGPCAKHRQQRREHRQGKAMHHAKRRQRDGRGIDPTSSECGDHHWEIIIAVGWLI